MKFNFKKLLLCVSVPLLVGFISSLISLNGFKDFKYFIKPSFAPPSVIFPIAWTVLFILMGLACYLVVNSYKQTNRIFYAITVYSLQLIFNFFLTIIFFNLKEFLFAFLWLILLWILILITVILFYKINKYTIYLLLPYILWVTFAGILNFFVYKLN